MTAPLGTTRLSSFGAVAHMAALILVAGLALILSGASILAAVGFLPWLELQGQIGGAAPAVTGQAVQITLTLLAVAMCVFIPAEIRVHRLERAHRDFRINMEDVARAYWQAHAADRSGLFVMRREFDAVRERFEFLRRHPDLDDVDPDLLEVAAQMSNESRELARIYSDEAVARARDTLELRRHEAADLERRIERARSVTTELRRTLDDVEMEEAMARSQIRRLQEQLEELLPGFLSPDPTPGARRVGPRLRVAKSGDG